MAEFVGSGDLTTDGFECCPNQQLEPIKCPTCGHIMVVCYESDDLFPNLHDLSDRSVEVNLFDTSRPAFGCPICGYSFEYSFPQNLAYKVTRDDLYAQGLEFILTSP